MPLNGLWISVLVSLVCGSYGLTYPTLVNTSLVTIQDPYHPGTVSLSWTLESNGGDDPKNMYYVIELWETYGPTPIVILYTFGDIKDTNYTFEVNVSRYYTIRLTPYNSVAAGTPLYNTIFAFSFPATPTNVTIQALSNKESPAFEISFIQLYDGGEAIGHFEFSYEGTDFSGQITRGARNVSRDDTSIDGVPDLPAARLYHCVVNVSDVYQFYSFSVVSVTLIGTPSAPANTTADVFPVFPQLVQLVPRGITYLGGNITVLTRDQIASPRSYVNLGGTISKSNL